MPTDISGTIPLDGDYVSHLPDKIDIAMMGCNGIVGTADSAIQQT